MFEWIKNIIRNTPSITPTTNLPDGAVKKAEPIVMETIHGNYTQSEINAFINDLKLYADRILEITETTDRYNRGEVGHIRYGWSDRLIIDLSRESTSYYLNICKTIRYLHGKVEFKVNLYYDNLDINLCNDIVFSYSEWLYSVSNFQTDSTFELLKSVDYSIPRPLNRIAIRLSKYDETELNKVLVVINQRKDSYIEYNYNNIKNEIESIVNQFPDNFYIVTINDTKKTESMYTLTEPLQEATGSYRINNVLFRGDYFALIPAVMFRINVESRSKKELTKKLINSCNSTYVQSKLNAYFGIDNSPER